MFDMDYYYNGWVVFFFLVPSAKHELCIAYSGL